MQPPTKPATRNGYSASVELFVHVDGHRLRPTHVSDREIIFAAPPHVRSGPATVEVVVDGLASTRLVNILPHAPEATRLPVSGTDVSKLQEVGKDQSASGEPIPADATQMTL